LSTIGVSSWWTLTNPTKGKKGADAETKGNKDDLKRSLGLCRRPEVKVLPSKADAVTWLTAEATAHGFVYEPPV